jgi:hypothetical protein
MAFERLDEILRFSELNPQEELVRAEAHLKTIPEDCETAALYRDYCEKLKGLLNES